MDEFCQETRGFGLFDVDEYLRCLEGEFRHERVAAGGGDKGMGSKKRKRNLSGSTGYSRPVDFVSSGSVDPDSKEEDDLGLFTGLSLGASGGRGFGSRKDEDDNSLLNAVRKKFKEGAQLRREKEKEKSMFAKKASTVGRRGLDPTEVGSFETHMKGIGMKLLEKMGYRGGGLGKYEQGILSPIEAKMRPKNMGVGFNHYEESTGPVLQELNENSSPLPSQPVEKYPSLKLRWKKPPQKKKMPYVTGEELLAKKKKEREGGVVENVIDMRGPEVRVFTNLKNLNAEEKKLRRSDVPKPELKHNNRLTIDSVDLDNQKSGNEREAAIALQKEMKQQIDNMEEIVRVLDQVDKQSSSGTLTLKSLAQAFADLQKRYADDYQLRNLSSIAFSYALPLFVKLFQGWDPLHNPTHGVDMLSLWKNLLQRKESRTFPYTTSPYEQLLVEVVFPILRVSCTNNWQTRDPKPMLRFLNSWENLLPVRVLQIIVDGIVLPKLSAAVASWDPHTETIPIHEWIRPWSSSLLGHKLEHCYQMIRDKFAYFLRSWQPNDVSAYNMLSPWRAVFDSSSWEKLMVRYVVPKLMAVMHDVEINPADQTCDEFDLVCTWATLIPTDHMVRLMDVFFDKWQVVLYYWLCSDPNFREVMEWYLGWKDRIPSELKAYEHIQYRLVIGLDMINQAVDGMEVHLQKSRSYFRAHEKSKFDAKKKQAHKAGSDDGMLMKDGACGFEMSLKEVIEIYAQQNGLLFKPKPERRKDGNQIYGFGNISIIIDSLNQKVFAKDEKKWFLVSLQRLLELHTRSKSKGQ